jgi:hypothetical protein
MATVAPQHPSSSLPHPLAALLSGLRRRIRRAVALEGLAYVVIALGVWFWLSLWFDWAWEPTRSLRLLSLLSVLAATLAVWWLWGQRRLQTSLSDASLALLLERRYPQLGDSLLTAVELGSSPPPAEECNRELLAAATNTALVRAGHIDSSAVLDASLLWRCGSVALILLLSVLGCLLFNPEAFGRWARRTALLSDEHWPRRTQLTIDGFPDGLQKVARGSDFTVSVRSATAGEVPRTVQLRYTADDGTTGRANMTREGNADPERDSHQQFLHTFTSLLGSLRIDVVGGDARIAGLQLQVVDSPLVTETTLDCVYPSYTGRPPAQLPASGTIALPEGTQARLLGRTNKDLVSIDIESLAASQAEQNQPTRLVAELAQPREFNLQIAPLQSDRLLLFRLEDTDGIRSREPFRLAISVVPDVPPQVRVHPRGVGSSVTPQARIPLVGTVRDDYGLKSAWIEITLPDNSSRRQEVTWTPTGDALAIDAALDLRELSLDVGQRVSLAVKAEDGYALGEAPHIGSSSGTPFDVVSPDTLRELLANRELNLRRRFESLVEEVTETQQSLARVTFEPESAAAATEEPADPEVPQLSDQERATRHRASQSLRVQRASQNSRKNAAETLDIGEAFAGILEEFVNNRIDTDELRSRLDLGIITPLREVGTDRFDRLQSSLGRLHERLESPAEAQVEWQAATQELAGIQQALAAVRDKMLELENFNEVVALLRTIIQAQEGLNEQTQQKRKQQARQLLE